MNEQAQKHRILTETDESEFLLRNRISRSDWSKSGCSWSDLQEIAESHENNSHNLLAAAEFIAKTIQNFAGVHSVRWRIKDTDHLIEKIIRKRSNEKSREKYNNINHSNYNEVITDLIGVRALHLFKDDCIDIHHQLLSTWTPIEPPIAYKRKGDSEDFVTKLEKNGFTALDHETGYRSLHYVVESKPTNRTMRAEIQVRTIFEEGWSEIDHTVRYPNFLDDPFTNYLLTIFNRMAGSADEMGEFVRQLALNLKESGDQLRAAIEDRDNAIIKIQAIIIELENARDSEEIYRGLASQLNDELQQLRESQAKEVTASNLFPDSAATNHSVTGLFNLHASEMGASFQKYRELRNALIHARKPIVGKTMHELNRSEDSGRSGEDNEER